MGRKWPARQDYPKFAALIASGIALLYGVVFGYGLLVGLFALVVFYVGWMVFVPSWRERNGLPPPWDDGDG